MPGVKPRAWTWGLKQGCKGSGIEIPGILFILESLLTEDKV